MSSQSRIVELGKLLGLPMPFSGSDVVNAVMELKEERENLKAGVAELRLTIESLRKDLENEDAEGMRMLRLSGDYKSELHKAQAVAVHVFNAWRKQAIFMDSQTMRLVESWGGTPGRKVVSIDEGVESDVQHENPCSDCPWSRKSIPGWLGGESAETWMRAVHGEEKIVCHTVKNQQCAGAAIFRANVAKVPRDKSTLVLNRNSELVFSSGDEFVNHHEPTGEDNG